MERGLLGQNEESEITGQGLVDNQLFESIESYTAVPCKRLYQTYRRGMRVPIEDFFYYPTCHAKVVLTIPKVDATIVMTMIASKIRISAAQVMKIDDSFTHELRLQWVRVMIRERDKNWLKS